MTPIDPAGRRLANALDDATVYSEEALTATVADARRQVETAINRTLRQFFSSRAPRTAHDLLSLARYPNAATLRISRAAEIFERTLEAIYQQELVGITYNISLEGESASRGTLHLRCANVAYNKRRIQVICTFPL